MRTLEGHTAPVTALLWVDGMLISGSWDTTIKIWDLKSGTCIRTLEGHLNTIQSLVCIDGMLISASVDTIKIWDIKSGTCTGKLPVEMQRYVPLDSADGNLISGHRKGRIKIWDLKSRTCTRILNGNNSDVCSLLWANGNLLSASEDHTIKIWDLKSGECIRTLECDDPERVIGHQGVRDPLWADGNLISGHPKGRIYIRDFSATTSIIFAEIANLFMSGSLYHVYRAIERFSCMPKKAKDKIYLEFSQILQLPACDLEIAKEIFHDLRKGSHKQKAQAIKNYLNPERKESGIL